MGQHDELHLVTGGSGYPGFRLAMALLKRGHQVRLLDLHPLRDVLPEGVTFIKGDISDYETVWQAFKGVDCVYHMASYGMSGREQLNKRLIEKVNVHGTENVIRACRECGVKRLVYTSTYNVVFGGQEIKNGDESLPYLPLDKHPDHYSRTKSIAEKIVLQSNGLSISSSSTASTAVLTDSHTSNPDNNFSVLKTCALRLAGVYGPGELRHLPRIVGYLKQGLFLFTYGKEDSLVEFLHVDNLVQAHVLAAEALQKPDSVAAGQAYFVSDCLPVNNFRFFQPLIEGLGYPFPKLCLPLFLIYFIALVTEYIHSIVGHVYNFQPFLTRTEVYKTGVTHFFNIGKAKRELGYRPLVQNDLSGALQWFKDHGYERSTHSSKGWSISSILFTLFLASLFTVFLLSFLPMVK